MNDDPHRDNAVDESPQRSWLRQCALCGALDADHGWPEPDLVTDEWECPRCAAVRYLWSAVPEQRRRTG